MAAVKVDPGRMPGWLSRQVSCGPEMRKVEGILSSEGLKTVCVGAKCPNRGECYSSGTATFMIMGGVCTRRCRFCAVPAGEVAPLREDEPEAVARAAATMELSHVVVTSVTRDDLPDGGAGHFARTVGAVREAVPGATVEVLVPDFMGSASAVEVVLGSGPDVFNHNVETVKRLYREARPRADYERTLGVIRRAAEAGAVAKSGFMVGLGETDQEILELLSDLEGAGCRIVTAGQYLRPAEDNMPVERYVSPVEFERIESVARELGFEAVASGPLVRSSYRAAELL